MKRKLTLFFLVLVIVLTGCQSRDYKRLTIIHTNDLHGHVLAEKVAGWDAPMGGYAVFAGWVDEVRRANREDGVPTLLLDGGDIFTGTPEGNLPRGASVIGLMNALGYDAMVLGNHEFDFGYYNLSRLAEAARFPFLAANVFRKNSGRLLEFVRPFVVMDLSGLKVAVVGVTTDETSDITLPRNVDRVVFKDPVATVRKCQELLQGEGADLLVVLSHLGLEEDVKLAEAVAGIDLIIGGHSHDLLKKPLRVKKNGTLICQAGEYGRYAGRLDVRVDRDDDKIAGYRYRVFVNRQWTYPPDLETDRVLEGIKKEVGDDFDRVIGLTLSDILPADREESCLGDMVADAVRQAAMTETAFQNAFGIRAPLLQGEITLRDVFKVLPFDDTIVTMELEGGRIKELLEQSLTFKKGLLQMSGVEAEYDLDRPEGRRLIGARIAGNPLEDKRFYSVAVNGFLAAGGDYFSAFKEGRNIRDTGVLLRDALRDYVANYSPLYRQGFAPSRWLKR